MRQPRRRLDTVIPDRPHCDLYRTPAGASIPSGTPSSRPFTEMVSKCQLCNPLLSTNGPNTTTPCDQPNLNTTCPGFCPSRVKKKEQARSQVYAHVRPGPSHAHEQIPMALSSRAHRQDKTPLLSCIPMIPFFVAGTRCRILICQPIPFQFLAMMVPN